jgi:hypothetical protein
MLFNQQVDSYESTSKDFNILINKLCNKFVKKVRHCDSDTKNIIFQLFYMNFLTALRITYTKTTRSECTISLTKAQLETFIVICKNIPTILIQKPWHKTFLTFINGQVTKI